MNDEFNTFLIETAFTTVCSDENYFVPFFVRISMSISVILIQQ